MELDGQPLITHDDRLLLRAQKSELGLFDNWRDGTRIARRAGARVIVSWHHLEDVKRSCSEPPAGEEHLWRPQYERTVPLEGVRVSLKCNQVDVELLDLQNDLRSRYRKALEVLAELVSAGVVRYLPRLSEPTPRNVLEAIRHRMRRYAHVALYEHNLLFRGALGTRILKALEPHDKAGGSFPGTVYLKGFPRYEGMEVAQKFYNVSQAEGRQDAPQDTLYKLETTLHKAFLKRHALRDIADFIEQPDIQEKLEEYLVLHLAGVLQVLKEEGVKMEQYEFSLKGSPKEQAHTILRRELTLTERVHALERGHEEHEKKLEEHADRLAVIEAHLGRKPKSPAEPTHSDAVSG
jgi:hypothetical protein